MMGHLNRCSPATLFGMFILLKWGMLGIIAGGWVLSRYGADGIHAAILIQLPSLSGVLGFMLGILFERARPEVLP